MTEQDFELTRIKLAENRLDVAARQLIPADTDYTLLHTVVSSFLEDFAGLDDANYIKREESIEVIKGGDDDGIIRGGNGNNIIFSGDGDDIVVFGGNSNDIIIGGVGIEGLYGESGNDFIYGDNGIDLLFGTDGNDLLDGGSGNDFLDGGPDSDILIGDDGSDFLDGSAGSDLIIGGPGDNFIAGGIGRDSDFLFGGPGRDTFSFISPRQGVDFIGDFNVLDDIIIVNNTGFVDGLVPGLLPESQFVLGSTTTTEDQRFIYNNSTGAFFFDPDGTGSIPQQQFVQLSHGLSLTSNNILVS